MNLLRYFESRSMKGTREHTDGLKRVVEAAKREQLEAEERLLEKLNRSREALGRPPVARALGRWEGQND